MSNVEELLQFLSLESRIDVKSLALQQILGLTGTLEGKKLLLQKSVIASLCTLFSDAQKSVRKDASLVIINLSADDKLTPSLLADDFQIIDIMLNIVSDPEHELADPASMILSNLSRIPLGSEKLFSRMLPNMNKYIDIFCQEKFNKKGAKLHYLAGVFSNLSQIPSMRKFVMDNTNVCLQRLVSFTDYKDSAVRRGGVIGLIKNCCFETDHHEQLLNENVDLLPKLLLPLAGPEEFDEEDNEKLPIDLQYLGEDKTREPDPDIRRMLLESLTQLCTTKFGREYLRSKNTYVILRELHKWEKDESVIAPLEHLVNILIRYEHEIGHDNLKQVEIPEDVVKKFESIEPTV